MLCAVLCDSHLIAASFLRLLRAPELENANPIFVSDTRHYTTSTPLKHYLLCEDCEKRFKKREDWVFRNCYRAAGEFRLRDVLGHQEPVRGFRNGLVIYRGASIPGIKIGDIIYFAISVFWRAGAHSWRRGRKTVHLELGPYLERLRLYLLDQSEFPTNVVLTMRVSSIEEWIPSVHEPESRTASGFRVHGFTVPGLNFMLLVGKTLSPYTHYSTAPGPDAFIGVSPEVDLRNLERATQRFERAKARGFKVPPIKMSAPPNITRATSP